MKISLWVLSVFLIITGIVVSFIFFRNLSTEYTYKGAGEILLDKSRQVGDFIGGLVGTIFSLAGFIILIITLSSQTQASYVEQFENKFFELVRLHRENVSEIVIKRKSKNEVGELKEFTFSSRQSFKIILNDFVTCRNELRQYFYKFDVDEIYELDYLLESWHCARMPEIWLKRSWRTGCGDNKQKEEGQEIGTEITNVLPSGGIYTILSRRANETASVPECTCSLA